jgi:hypothetical protein
MSRENLEKQFNLQYKDKTPEEMMEIGRQIALKSMQEEKKESLSKVQALRTIFNILNPLSSNRFKK